MSADHFIGVDPGPTPGLVMLTPRGFGRTPHADVVQCTAEVAPLMLWSLLHSARMARSDDPKPVTAVVAIERFVVGRGSMRAGSAGAVTRDLVGHLEHSVADQIGVSVVLRNAAQVKSWATDARLEAAGLLSATKGMRHAKDAARHALYAAVRDGAVHDPLRRIEAV